MEQPNPLTPRIAARLILNGEDVDYAPYVTDQAQAEVVLTGLLDVLLHALGVHQLLSDPTTIRTLGMQGVTGAELYRPLFGSPQVRTPLTHTSDVARFEAAELATVIADHQEQVFLLRRTNNADPRLCVHMALIYHSDQRRLLRLEQYDAHTAAAFRVEPEYRLYDAALYAAGLAWLIAAVIRMVTVVELGETFDDTLELL